MNQSASTLSIDRAALWRTLYPSIGLKRTAPQKQDTTVACDHTRLFTAHSDASQLERDITLPQESVVTRLGVLVPLKQMAGFEPAT
jgi:hypothetical protein